MQQPRQAPWHPVPQSLWPRLPSAEPYSSEEQQTVNLLIVDVFTDPSSVSGAARVAQALNADVVCAGLSVAAYAAVHSPPAAPAAATGKHDLCYKSLKVTQSGSCLCRCRHWTALQQAARAATSWTSSAFSAWSCTSQSGS